MYRKVQYCYSYDFKRMSGRKDLKGEADFISWIDLFWQKKPHEILR